MLSSLTDRQRRFVDAYLENRNGKQAAISAGYSAATAVHQASRLLRSVKVVAEMERRSALVQSRSGVTQDMVLAELAKLGFSDIRQVVRWCRNQSDDGDINQVFLVDSDQLNDEAAAAIAEITQGKDGSLKVKLHDKLAALVKIGQHLGMFRPASTPADDLGKKSMPISPPRMPSRVRSGPDC